MIQNKNPKTYRTIKQNSKRSQLELVEVFIDILSQGELITNALFQKAGTNYTTGSKILDFLKKWRLAEDVPSKKKFPPVRLSQMARDIIEKNKQDESAVEK